MITSCEFFVEYSPEQKCCHIDTQDKCLWANLKGVLAGKPVSFIPLGSFPDHDAAQKFWESVRNKIPTVETLREESGNG